MCVGLVAALTLLEVVAHVAERARLASARGYIENLPAKTPKSLYYWTRMGKRTVPDLDVMLVDHPVSRRNIRVRTNDLGLRGAPVPPRESEELRVLVLGDSVTFADQVEEGETFVVGVESGLRSRRGARPVRVLNAGGPSLGTLDQAAWLGELAPALRPDVVVLGFYLNDSAGQVRYPDVLRIPGWWPWRYSAEWAAARWAQIRHRSVLAERYRWVHEFLERRWVDDEPAYHRLVALASEDWGAAWREESWPVVEQGLRHMQALGDRHGFRLVVAVLPVSVQAESRVNDDRPQRHARALTDQLGVPSVDLLPALRGAPSSLFYDQCHLRPAGHARVAERLTAFLAELPPP